MKSQTQDALLGTIEGICRHHAELSRKVRTMELLLSQHNRAVYQEYMDRVVGQRSLSFPKICRKRSTACGKLVFGIGSR